MSGVTDRQERVEHGLRAALEFEGREPERFSLADRMARFAVPGASIAVVDEGRVAWAQGYGVAGPDGRVVDTSTLFQAASISKAVAAVGVLALVEHGVLDLDADVNESLRSWHLARSEHTDGRPVTLRDLLSHTAGTTVPGFPGYAHDVAVPTAVQVLAGEHPANTPVVESFARPGTRTQYSGGGTTIVQVLVGDVTGRDYAELLHELVLAPFGMTDSAYDQPIAAHRLPRAAAGHDASGNPVVGGHHTYPELQAAGLWTTAVDLARWVIGVQETLRGDRQGPISRETATLMITEVGDGPFGLGPELGGQGSFRRFGHSGSNEGFRGQVDGLVHAPTGAVVLTNGAGGTTLAAELRKAFADEYGWGPLGGQPIRLAEVDHEVLRGYTGRYAGPFDLPMRLEFADGELFMPAPYGRRRALPLGETTFLDEETGATLEVELTAGRVARIAVLVDGAELMAFTPVEHA